MIELGCNGATAIGFADHVYTKEAHLTHSRIPLLALASIVGTMWLGSVNAAPVLVQMPANPSNDVILAQHVRNHPQHRRVTGQRPQCHWEKVRSWQNGRPVYRSVQRCTTRVPARPSHR